MHQVQIDRANPTVDNTLRYHLYFINFRLRAIQRAYAFGFALVHLHLVHALISPWKLAEWQRQPVASLRSTRAKYVPADNLHGYASCEQQSALNDTLSVGPTFETDTCTISFA